MIFARFKRRKFSGNQKVFAPLDKLFMTLLFCFTLTSCKSTPSVDNLGGFEKALISNDSELIKSEITKIKNISSCEDESLIQAALYNPNAISLLVSAGANINCRDNEGDTPLHYAAYYNTDVLPFIENGAQVNAKNNKGYTPLHYASDKLELNPIYKQGWPNNLADYNVNNFYDKNAKVNKENIKSLIVSGADVNSRTTDKLTPLLIAAKNNIDAIVPLIVFGANPLQTDSDGKNAIVRFRDKYERTLVLYKSHISSYKTLYPNLKRYEDAYGEPSVLVLQKMLLDPIAPKYLKPFAALKLAQYGEINQNTPLLTQLALLEEKQILHVEEERRKAQFAAQKAAEKRTRQQQVLNEKVNSIKSLLANDSQLKEAFSDVAYSSAYCSAFHREIEKIDDEVCSFKNKYGGNEWLDECYDAIRATQDRADSEAGQYCDNPAKQQLYDLFGDNNEQAVSQILEEYTRNKTVEAYTIRRNHPVLDISAIENMMDRYETSVKREQEAQQQRLWGDFIESLSSPYTKEALAVNKVFQQGMRDTQRLARNLQKMQDYQRASQQNSYGGNASPQARNFTNTLNDLKSIEQRYAQQPVKTISANNALNQRRQELIAQHQQQEQNLRNQGHNLPSSSFTPSNNGWDKYDNQTNDSGSKECVARSSSGGYMPEAGKKYCKDTIRATQLDVKVSYSENNQIQAPGGGAAHEDKDYALTMLKQSLLKKAEKSCTNQNYDYVLSEDFELNEVNLKSYNCKVVDGPFNTKPYLCQGSASFYCGKYGQADFQ